MLASLQMLDGKRYMHSPLIEPKRRSHRQAERARNIAEKSFSLSINKTINIVNVCCTHGNEVVGSHIHENFNYGKNEFYKWNSVIGNEKALGKSRYIEADLNRVFPGKKYGNYEEKRAYELMSHLQHYDLIIDWHQSVSDMDDLILINKNNSFIRDICKHFNIKHVIELDTEKSTDDYNGLLIHQFKNAIAIEYGRCPINIGDNCLDSSRAKKDADHDFRRLINKKPYDFEQKTYRFFGTVNLRDKGNLRLLNFRPLEIEEKRYLGIPPNLSVYPAFIDGYKDQGIYCRLLERVR
jgi:succinylglutamate desuccinylase